MDPGEGKGRWRKMATGWQDCANRWLADPLIQRRPSLLTRRCGNRRSGVKGKSIIATPQDPCAGVRRLRAWVRKYQDYFRATFREAVLRGMGPEFLVVV